MYSHASIHNMGIRPECWKNKELKPCADCSWKNGPLPFQCFNKRMWRRKDRTRKCNECISYVKRETHSCCNCNQQMTQIHFTDYQWERLRNKRQCIKCTVSSNATANIGNWTLRRYTCRQTLAETNFSIWKQKQSPNSRSNWKV